MIHGFAVSLFVFVLISLLSYQVFHILILLSLSAFFDFILDVRPKLCHELAKVECNCDSYCWFIPLALELGI